MLNKEHLGQVFTSQQIVKLMISLIQHNGNILEPSCGDGSFLSQLDCDNVTAIELDKNVAHKHAIITDFFTFSVDNKFDTIIGNPPYVRNRNILNSTKKLLRSDLLNSHANLYHFFIEKCIHHLKPNGEIIFITPRDTFTNTASKRLNEFLYDHGTITHYIDFSDNNVFDDANLDCIIWRFSKDNFTRQLNDGRKFICENGSFYFLNDGDFDIKMSDILYVKVGGVSGKNDIYYSSNGLTECITSKTFDTGKTTKVIFDQLNNRKLLLDYKDTLLSRKGRLFTEKNWWEWIRKPFISDVKRIYVNVRTRKDKPFFTHECKFFDGSIIALVPLNQDIDLDELCDDLNSINWTKYNIKQGNRFIFKTNLLLNMLLPSTFKKYI